MNRKAVFGFRLHDHRRGVGELHLLGNRRPVRRVRDDFVARVVQHHRRVVERLLAARGDDALGFGEADAVVGLVARADRLLQVGHAGRRRVFGEVLIDRDLGRVLRRLRRRKIGLACAEVDDVDALALQFCRFAGHLHRRRCGDSAHPLS